ncbi:MAG TPA: ATP-binding cassette domain-containing protein [Atribacteraceae bacterium]|nr:ATP-binding cassette domain-containing protein [Atribacteraceae bacterium]
MDEELGKVFIEFKRVYKIYPNGARALNNISLVIEEGEFVFLVGVTGAGKSTLLKLITREEVPTSGNIWLEGFRVNQLDDGHLPILRRNIGVVFQDLRLLSSRTVLENLIFPLEVMGVARRSMLQLADMVLDTLCMQEKKHHRIEWLSGGEKQKLCIGRAVIHRPRLILADEPTGNLDGETAVDMVTTLYEYCRDKGITVIMSTHNKYILERFPARLVYLNGGEVVYDRRRD